jgi:hypothetical protein
MHREGLAQPATGMTGRDDDKVVGEIKRAAPVPFAGEEGNRRRQNRLSPAGELAGEGSGGGRLEDRSDGEGE